MAVTFFKLTEGGDYKLAIDTTTGQVYLAKEESGVVSSIVELAFSTSGGSGSSVLTFLAGPDEVTVDTTATGKTLATLIGSALETDVKRITLITQGAGICWADGNATAGINPIPYGVISVEGTKAQWDTRKFIVASGTVKMTVIQEG